MKVSIIGTGHVGATSAYALMMSGVVSDMVLVDIDPDLAQAQAMDLSHAVPFGPPCRIKAGKTEDVAHSQVVILACGANQKPGQDRLSLMQHNANVFLEVVPEILRLAPKAILIVASNPVDVMTFVTTRIAQRLNVFQLGKVMGTGTILDSARFKSLLSEHLKVSTHSIHANVLGEHGDTEVLHWSGATVANMPLDVFATRRGVPLTSKIRQHIDQGVRKAAYTIISGKGMTNFGIGAGVAGLVRAIALDEGAVLTVSTTTESVEGISDVALSLPHVVGANGAESPLFPPLDPEEHEALKRSAFTLKAAAKTLLGET